MNEHEPIHVHVAKAGKEARIVLVPVIDVSYNRGFGRTELRKIIDLVLAHYDKLPES